MRKKLLTRYKQGIMMGLAFIILSQIYLALVNPEAEERLSQNLKDIPAYIPYSVSLLLLGMLLWLVYLFVWVVPRQTLRESMESVRIAQEINKTLWQVDAPPRYEKGFVTMKLNHASWNQRYFILPVRSGHPDIESFRKLNTGDIIEFKALSKGMNCALAHELCGFLRIKHIEKVS